MRYDGIFIGARLSVHLASCCCANAVFIRVAQVSFNVACIALLHNTTVVLIYTLFYSHYEDFSYIHT